MKNYVLCASLDEQSLNTLKKIRTDLDLRHAKVHIVTVMEIQSYLLGVMPYIYPTEAQYPEIEEGAISVLKGLADSLGIPDNQIVLKCFFSNEREKPILKYLKEVNADLVVTATRGKHGIEGLFASSFTDYLCRFSPCDVLAIRPVK